MLGKPDGGGRVQEPGLGQVPGQSTTSDELAKGKGALVEGAVAMPLGGGGQLGNLAFERGASPRAHALRLALAGGERRASRPPPLRVPVS